MMASFVLNSVRSALNDLERSDYFRDKRDDIKYRLKNQLELFVVCARKLGNDVLLRIYDGEVTTLAALFQRILDVLSRYPPPYNNSLKMLDFECAIDNLKEEIRCWYNAFVFSLPQPTLDEVTDFIDSVLNNLNYHRSRYHYPERDQTIEALIEKIRFLRNFIRSVEPPQLLDNLLAHIQAVAVDAAHNSYIYSFHGEYGVGPNIPVLLQIDMEIDVPDSGLLQRINRITQIVKGKDFSIPNLLQRISRIEQRFISDINMMASLVLNSIRSALWGLLVSNYDYTRFMTEWKLKNLEMFVVCARKLGNDAQLRFDDGKVASLASLFQRIHLALSRDPPTCKRVIPENLRCAIANFKEEIGGWYNTLLVSLPQPTFDQVTDFIDSVLKHLNYHVLYFDLLYRRTRYHGTYYYWPSMQPIEALIEKITFLRNFIRFATLCVRIFEDINQINKFRKENIL